MEKPICPICDEEMERWQDGVYGCEKCCVWEKDGITDALE